MDLRPTAQPAEHEACKGDEVEVGKGAGVALVLLDQAPEP
jgi:hypothetical protein